MAIVDEEKKFLFSVPLAPNTTSFVIAVAIINRFFLTLGLWAIAHSVIGQCSDWEKLFYYKSVSIGDIAHDRFGNTYIAGSFFEDGFTLGSNTFTLPVGQGGAFIAKFDSNNVLVWAISPTVGYSAYAKQIEVDADDNIIVAGDFDTSISFGCLSFPGSGRSDIFVVKFTPDGTPIWLTGSTGADDSAVVKISMSPNGNCILTSSFVESSDVTTSLTAPDITMGGLPVLTDATDQINAGYDSFIASIEPDGTVAWTQGIGGDGNHYDYVSDVTTDTEDNIIVTGYFNSDRILFDGYEVRGLAFSENYYLAKINSQGETLWVRGTEGTINQGGAGVDTDAENNIYVEGRFYGNAKFGSFTLTGKGEADVFVVKLTPDGTVTQARSFGDDGFDAATGLKVNSQGKVLISSYYYSEYLQVGAFTSTMSDLSGADGFVATLSNDLSMVECVKFITGDGESIIRNFELDPSDNVIVTIDLMVWDENAVNIGSYTFDDADYWSVTAILGNNPAVYEGETPPDHPVLPGISLGRDTTLCAGQRLTLSVPPFCDATYKWSTGRTGTSIQITTPGVYWVEVTRNGDTTHDDITVSYHEPIQDIDLGNDRLICLGETVSWNLPVYDDTVYKWSDGTTSNQKSIIIPGTYWVEASNGCETIRKTVIIQVKPPSEVDLGNDVEACSNTTISFTPAPGETLHWSDGSTSPSLVVTKSGTYQLTVNNGCTDTTDDIQVTIKNPGESSTIPNVVTVNGDGKNDHFVLPAYADKSSLLIVNRWGDKVFYASEYQNNWPLQTISTGVYFYTLHGECIPAQKGSIHVINP